MVDSFGDLVRSLRRARGWTQEELARQIDVSLSTVQRWENKYLKPTRLARRELKKLFTKAGLDINEDWIGTQSRMARGQQSTDLGESLSGMD